MRVGRVHQADGLHEAARKVLARLRACMLPGFIKGTLLGTPNREPQEYSRNITVYKDPGRYIPIIYLLYSWGSQFGVSSRVPLFIGHRLYVPR